MNASGCPLPLQIRGTRQPCISTNAPVMLPTHLKRLWCAPAAALEGLQPCQRC